MRIKVNPLVVAAALGLLGPAALAEEDEQEDRGLAGVWQRKGHAQPACKVGLGDRIEVIPFEGTVLLDDGRPDLVSRGEWTLEGPQALQQLRVEGAQVTRRFQADGDLLAVHTTVSTDGDERSWSETFVRQG